MSIAKKLLSFSSMALVMSLGSQAFAASTMTCKLGVYVASVSGLMPLEKDLTISGIQIQSTQGFDLEKCQNDTYAGVDMSLCALDTEAKGVYKIELSLFARGQRDFEYHSVGQILAEPKKGSTLVGFEFKTAMNPYFTTRASAKGINVPEYTGGDSLAIDEAVGEAVKKGIVDKSDVVAISIGDCSTK